ncbi:MAG TPA: MarC family protein [Stellaceae bacterium]|nr:MarC family protein [Stellaceae bacterium]
MPYSIAYSFVTLLVIIDPVSAAAVFATLTGNVPDEFSRRTAWRAIAIAGALLLVFAFLGEWVLEALGITLPAFRIAGGILLFLLATDMVFARRSGIRTPTVPEQEEASRSTDVSVFPLAFPLLAGPGALTSIMLLMGRARSPLEAAGVIGAMAAVLLLTLVVLLSAVRVMRFLGVTGANVVTRILGIVLAALAAQLVLDGLTPFLGRPV